MPPLTPELMAAWRSSWYAKWAAIAASYLMEGQKWEAMIAQLAALGEGDGPEVA